jgi:hypothetical protein
MRSVDGGSSMPALAASCCWSTAEKNMMPFFAMSSLMRAMVSSIE